MCDVSRINIEILYLILVNDVTYQISLVYITSRLPLTAWTETIGTFNNTFFKYTLKEKNASDISNLVYL